MRVFLIVLFIINRVVAFITPASSSAPHRASSFIQASPTSTVTEVLGTVKWFNVERGYGFIALDAGGPDMYVHATGLTFDGPLVENERVSFISEFDKRTNKPKAVNVSRTTAEVAPTHAVIMTSIDDEPSVSLVDEVMESVSKELDDFKSSIKLEIFQRARLAAQLRQAAECLALRAAEECRLEQEAEECRLAEEATKAAAAVAMMRSIKEEKFQRARLEAQVKQMEVERMTMIAAKAAADAEVARIAEEMRLADEAAKAAAEAKAAEKARIAEEMRLVEEAEECRLAEEATKAAAALAMMRSIKKEKFQRARLESQVKQMEVERMTMIAAKAAADAEVARIAEEMRLADEAAKAAAEAEAKAAEAEKARIAEEMRLAEEAAKAKAVAKAKATAEAESARIAEEMRLKKLEESEALELGFPSAAIMKKRLQPKSPEEEAALSAKYGAMSLGEKAFAILTDLGMIDLNPDPNDPNRDTSKDNDNLE